MGFLRVEPISIYFDECVTGISRRPGEQGTVEGGSRSWCDRQLRGERQGLSAARSRWGYPPYSAQQRADQDSEGTWRVPGNGRVPHKEV